MGKIELFEDFLMFQQARELSKSVYQITREGDFKYSEGLERDGNKEFINFIFISKGSCGEVRSQLIRAHNVGFIYDANHRQSLYASTKTLGEKIADLIRTLKNSEISGQKYKKQ